MLDSGVKHIDELLSDDTAEIYSPRESKEYKIRSVRNFNSTMMQTQDSSNMNRMFNQTNVDSSLPTTSLNVLTPEP